MNPPTDQPEDEKPNNLCAELTHLREVLASSNRSREEWREKLFGPDGKSGLVAEAAALKAQISELRITLEMFNRGNALGYIDDVLSKTAAQFEGMTCVKAEELEEGALAIARLHWLHDCSTGATDADGCEWGIYRVKWKDGKAVEVWQTNSDFSDLDAEMKREMTGQPLRKYEDDNAASTPPKSPSGTGKIPV